MAPPNTFEERTTPGLGDDADMDADDQLSQDGGASGSSSLAGIQHSSHQPHASGSGSHRGPTSIRTRITVVCAECKRLKLRCDRRTPCGSCIKRETVARCTYSAAASEKIDVQSVHNATVSQMNLITALYRALGISEDQMDQLMNAQSYPPHEGYELPIDADRMRALVLNAPDALDPSASASTTKTALPSTDTRRRLMADSAQQDRWRKMVHDGFIVAFSQPPSIGAAPPTMDRFGEPRRRATLPSIAGATPSAATRALLHTAHRPAYSSLGATMARTAVDLASRVFQANSVLVPTEFEGALRLWCGAMGWEPRAVNECAVPSSSFLPNHGMIDSGMESSGEMDGGRRKRRDVIPVVAPFGELDYQDAQRPKDLLAVGMAYQLFVGPASQAAMAAAGFPLTVPGGAGAGGSATAFPFTFSALGSNGQPTSPPPQPNSPFGTHPNVTSQPTSPPASHTTPPTTTSGSSVSNNTTTNTSTPLLTPQHILAHLPTKEWRAVLLSEFESFMIVHEGVCGSHRSLWRRRIERMFEWAEHFASAGAAGGATAGPDSGAESGSQVSSSSQGRSAGGSGKRRAGKARSSNAGMSTSGASSEHRDAPPPPPTMGLFAVACGVFAIGALGYACKAVHGLSDAPPAQRTTTDGQEAGPAQKDGGSSEAGASVSSSVAMPPPSLPFSVSFSLTGGGPGSAGPLLIPGTSSTKPNPLIHSLPPSYTPHVLHSLHRATIIAHDQLDLPPSLDLLYAHVLGWLYLLHPSDSLSNVTNNGFDGSVRGVGGGGVTVVEPVIWKELGKCVNVARGMGLGVVDDGGYGEESREARRMRRMHRNGGEDEEGAAADEDISFAEKMGLWEREMRRRVWWELCWFDLWISDAMGHAPLISEDTSASTKIPSNVDESIFDPTSTSLPPPAPGSAPGSNLAHFVAKCRLQLLMRELPRQPIRDAVTGELSIDAAQAFEAKVNAWKDSLPDSFSITFGSTVEETKFPAADVAAMQACDLHIMANALVMRLWFPFVKDFLGRPTLQAHQNAALACSTAANSIIVASRSLLTRYRSTHPLHFGFYGFGRNVWLAATLLASILISMPQIIWAATCRKGLEVALSIARDQLLSGKIENGVNPKYEVIQLLQQLQSMAERFCSAAGPATGSKRKATDHVETVKLRGGFQIPYVGLSAVSAPGEIDLPMGRQESFKRSVVVNATPAKRTEIIPLEDMDVVALEPPEPRQTPLPIPKASRNRTVSQPAWPETSTHVVGGHNGEYVPPPAATFPRNPRKPPSEVSQSSSLQGKPAPPTAKRSFPVIGIRDRTKTQQRQQQQQQQDSGSGTEKGKGPASDVSSSRTKRPKSSSGREGTPKSSAPSPIGRSGQLQHTYPQPTPEASMAAPGPMGGSVPPPIQKSAPPQPTYYTPPAHQVQSSSMSDVGSQVSIGPSGLNQYRGPGSDFSSTYTSGPRNGQPQQQDYAMTMQHQNPAGASFQGAQTREYGLPMGHASYSIDDAMSTLSGGGSDFYAGSAANSAMYHHGPGSAVGAMPYSSGSDQNFGGLPQQPQQQQQQPMQMMASHQNFNDYGAHQQQQYQQPQQQQQQQVHDPANFGSVNPTGGQPSRGWRDMERPTDPNFWRGSGTDPFNFGSSIA